MSDPLAQLERLLADAKKVCLGAFLSDYDETKTWQTVTLAADRFEVLERLVNAAPHLIAVARAAQRIYDESEQTEAVESSHSYGPAIIVGHTAWEESYQALAGLRAHLGETEA